jgi:hypothetical protein
MLKRLLLALLVAALPTAGLAQSTVLQGGYWTSGLAPMYSFSGGGSQPIIQQSAPASGGAQSLKELSIVARGTGTPPFVGQGTGYLGSLFCMYDAPIANATGGHQFCFSPNATGGFGLLSFNAFGSASNIPLKLSVNGTVVEFPFSTSGVVGPSSSVINDIACWNNISGTLLKDCGSITTVTPGGSNGAIQYNNAGAFGGFTASGDCTIVASTGVVTCTKINNVSVSLGGTLTTGGAFTTSGASALTLTTTGSTNVTLPTTGTLSTLAGSEALTNKTVNGLTITSTSGGTLTIANGKTLTASNTLILAGTDGSTLNIGTGGTLGTAAFTAATAYVPSNTQVTNSISGDVNLNNASNYFDGPSVAQGATGTWFCSGAVTITDGSSGAASVDVKLWDGTTVLDSGRGTIESSTHNVLLSLSGYLVTPAANIKISAKSSSTTSVMKANASGGTKDSTVSCFRVN